MTNEPETPCACEESVCPTCGTIVEPYAPPLDMRHWCMSCNRVVMTADLVTHEAFQAKAEYDETDVCPHCGTPTEATTTNSEIHACDKCREYVQPIFRHDWQTKRRAELESQIKAAEGDVEKGREELRTNCRSFGDIVRARKAIAEAQKRALDATVELATLSAQEAG